MTPRITETELRKRGYRLVRGSYYGTSDDRADRWYFDRLDSDVIDRRGSGHATKREALDHYAAITPAEDPS